MAINVKNIIGKVGNALIKSNFLPVRMYNTARTIASIPQVKQQISNFSTGVNNAVASVPYKLEENKINSISKNRIPVNWSDPVAKQNAIDTVNRNSPKWGNSYVAPAFTDIGRNVARNPYSWTGSFDPVGQMKEFSHPLQMTYNAPQITTSPELEQLKQKIIGGLRPEAQQFLSKVPIRFDNGMKTGTLGESRDKSTPGRSIAISGVFNEPENQSINPKYKQSVLDFKQKELEKVVRHELLHQTPRLVPMELFKPENQVAINEYTDRWGQAYMERPEALVEEMFAEQNLPPAYYWHIFKNVNPNATKKNFVDTLKAYFVNDINKPQIQPQVGVAGTAVRSER